MSYPYDEEFEEDSGVYDPNERPTVAEGRRAKRRELAQDPDYKLGRIIVESIRLRRDVDYLLQNERRVSGRGGSIFHRPPVQTAGISAIAAIVVAVLAKLAEKLGMFQ